MDPPTLPSTAELAAELGEPDDFEDSPAPNILDDMGFTIAEELKIDNLGVSHAGCYVTFKGVFAQGKIGSPNPMPMGMPMAMDNSKPVILSGRYYVYAEKNSALQPLKEEHFSVALETSPNTTIAIALYTALKSAKFAAFTITDDL
jgi:hypothetical protein